MALQLSPVALYQLWPNPKRPLQLIPTLSRDAFRLIACAYGFASASPSIKTFPQYADFRRALLCTQPLRQHASARRATYLAQGAVEDDLLLAFHLFQQHRQLLIEGATGKVQRPCYVPLKGTLVVSDIYYGVVTSGASLQLLQLIGRHVSQCHSSGTVATQLKRRIFYQTVAVDLPRANTGGVPDA